MRLALHIPNPRALDVEYTRVVIKSILRALALRPALGRSIDELSVQPKQWPWKIKNKGGGDPLRSTTIELIIVRGGGLHLLPRIDGLTDSKSRKPMAQEPSKSECGWLA
jgi:hypothetical protein